MDVFCLFVRNKVAYDKHFVSLFFEEGEIKCFVF